MYHESSPRIHGEPIDVTFLPVLKAHRGAVRSGKSQKGTDVHAASFLRTRRIVLDSELRRRPAELARIFTHELFHFVWLRLGNPARRSWEELLNREFSRRSRGELGWSAESIKEKLAAKDRKERTRLWRSYACESFCDSAAWLFHTRESHPEFTLGFRARQTRRRWFCRLGLTRQISV